MPSVSSPTSSPRAPLYDLHTGPGGLIHFAAHSEEGHRLGMALLERMWQLDDERDARPLATVPPAEPATAAALQVQPVVTVPVRTSTWPRQPKYVANKAAPTIVAPAPAVAAGGGKLLCRLPVKSPQT